jgi:hypothetical protein
MRAPLLGPVLRLLLGLAWAWWRRLLDRGAGPVFWTGPSSIPAFPVLLLARALLRVLDPVVLGADSGPSSAPSAAPSAGSQRCSSAGPSADDAGPSAAPSGTKLLSGVLRLP